MSDTYPGIATWSEHITRPTSGDRRTVSSVRNPQREIADRTTWLRTRNDSGIVRARTLADTDTIRQIPTGELSANTNRPDLIMNESGRFFAFVRGSASDKNPFGLPHLTPANGPLWNLGTMGNSGNWNTPTAAPTVREHNRIVGVANHYATSPQAIVDALLWSNLTDNAVLSNVQIGDVLKITAQCQLNSDGWGAELRFLVGLFELQLGEDLLAGNHTFRISRVFTATANAATLNIPLQWRRPGGVNGVGAPGGTPNGPCMINVIHVRPYSAPSTV